MVTPPIGYHLLQAIPRLKDALRINVELAAPDQFIPPLPDWETRSPVVARERSFSALRADADHSFRMSLPPAIDDFIVVV